MALVFQNWPCPGSTSLLAASGVSELALPWLNITAGCFWCFRTGPALAQHHCWLLLVFQNWPCPGSTSLLAASGVSELALPWLNTKQPHISSVSLSFTNKTKTPPRGRVVPTPFLGLSAPFTTCTMSPTLSARPCRKYLRLARDSHLNFHPPLQNNHGSFVILSSKNKAKTPFKEG